MSKSNDEEPIDTQSVSAAANEIRMCIEKAEIALKSRKQEDILSLANAGRNAILITNEMRKVNFNLNDHMKYFYSTSRFYS